MISAMTMYAALLRGINLGKRNRIAMADLRALFERLGHRSVATHVQSGNVVFEATGATAARLAASVHDEIQASVGLDVGVILRSAAELARIVRDNPFGDADRSQLYVTLLAERPKPKAVAELATRTYEPDEYRVVGREVYLHCPNGYGRSKLSNELLERRLGVGATTRNWRTMTTLAEMTSG
jgi:uncharacterized protein (DUF1697 family)